jgi:formylglycine-generating enzyme required for sulfatase activity
MKKLLFIIAIIFACLSTMANNIQITNVSVVPANNTIKFDLSWENSWRSNTLNNWDAAWVFFKYKSASGKWEHIYLTNTGNVIPSGFVGNVAVEPTGPSSGIGAFIHRSVVGSGTSILTNIEIGIAPDNASGVYDIKAFAIEMVYIPQAPFVPGDGVSNKSYNLNYPVTSPSTFIFDSIPPIFYNSNTFPNGFNAFYCMKYELSQGGYRDFLNTIKYNAAATFTLNEQTAHTFVAPTSAPGTYALSSLNRSYIKIKTSAINPATPAVYGCDANNNGIYDEANDGENVACNFLNWADHARYLIWAGLRPLTEMEFEKAGRGIQLPVSSEYAWGNNNIAGFIYTIGSPNTNAEIITNATASTVGNANNISTYPNPPYAGPLRNGIFATATSTRISSGASFYGVMELSGNLWERVISTATTEGRNFTGVHGTGQYPTSGIFNWPAYDAAVGSINASLPASGIMYRGGSWNYPNQFLRLSDRGGSLFGSSTTDNLRFPDVGVRGCRTAP